MKIAIIGPAYPFRGGLAAYNERLALQLIKEGHDVTMYTFTLQYPSFLFPGKTQYSEDKPNNNLKIIRCINSISPINWIKVGLRIKKENPDLVINRYWLPFMGPSMGTISRIIRKNNRTKIITLVDNIIPHEKRIGDTLLTNYFVNSVDGFLVMSQCVYDDVKKFNTTKPIVLSPHPLFDNFGDLVPKDLAKKTLNLDPNNRYILFFGLIRKYKGLDLLIKAFSDKRFENQNIKLIIAGEYYESKEEYQKMINLNENIIQIEKFIPDSDVKYLFSASDLVVQPYRDATQSGVTQIAYHFNVPMIVTNVGGLEELVPHEKVGYVTNPDEDEISDRIHQFFNQTDIEKMVDNIKIEKKKYSWEILTQSIYKLAKSI